MSDLEQPARATRYDRGRDHDHERRLTLLERAVFGDGTDTNPGMVSSLREIKATMDGAKRLLNRWGVAIVGILAGAGLSNPAVGHFLASIARVIGAP